MKLARLLLKLGLAAGALLLLGFIALLAYVLYTQHHYETMADTHDLEARINKMGTAYVGKRPNAGLVIGVVQRGRRHIQTFGKVNATNADPPNAETLFEIGSVTKVFTALALAKIAGDGAVALGDPISRYLPGNVVSPQKNGREITLLDLATHASGLPRLPDNFNASSKDELNPYESYKAADLYKDLSARKLADEPGKNSDYSNYGFGLLGHILELKTGKPFEQLIMETVCAPLAMTNTTVHLSADQKTRLTPGHNAKDQIVPNWDFNVLAGCGAFRSDADDLLGFVEANLNNPPSSLSPALAETQRFHFKKFSGGVGLGWQIAEPVNKQILHWHNGGTGGYASFVGFDLVNQVGVVILSNYGDALAGDSSVDGIAMEILEFAPKISFQ
jgi:CubicO group peptidase (beta-lactamase class C family)